MENILAAGRCIGTLEDAWEVYRVIPVAVMTGEAAGVAAALCANHGLRPANLPYDLLKKELQPLPRTALPRTHGPTRTQRTGRTNRERPWHDARAAVICRKFCGDKRNRNCRNRKGRSGRRSP
ncbi:MAG: FAD-dependent oxidoreductase [Lentisphaerae bacterium]|nr:FAD-dependent oxidoreductase [Lentisphaerota bacterium]